MAEFDGKYLLSRACMASTRGKALHDEFGYFRDDSRWRATMNGVRISERYPFKHIPAIGPLFGE
jgi:hypothetical protein